MPTITIRQTYARIKLQIASDKNRPPSAVLADHNLRSDLRYTMTGLRALERSLNGLFTDVRMSRIGAGEFAEDKSMETVRSWTWGAWKKIPSENKEE